MTREKRGEMGITSHIHSPDCGSPFSQFLWSKRQIFSEFQVSVRPSLLLFLMLLWQEYGFVTQACLGAGPKINDRKKNKWKYHYRPTFYPVGAPFPVHQPEGEFFLQVFFFLLSVPFQIMAVSESEPRSYGRRIHHGTDHSLSFDYPNSLLLFSF